MEIFNKTRILNLINDLKLGLNNNDNVKAY